jgi:hypothetical protein
MARATSSISSRVETCEPKFFIATIGLEPMTPDEIAVDYDIPVAAVLEAIQYSVQNAALLERERDVDWAESRALHFDNDPTRDLTPRGTAAAIAKLENSGTVLSDNVHVLNHWR